MTDNDLTHNINNTSNVKITCDRLEIHKKDTPKITKQNKKNFH